MVEIFNKIMNEIDKYETVIIHRHVRPRSGCILEA